MPSKIIVMTPKEVLKKFWGFNEFRPLQEEIIQSVLEGHDTLALLPTGGGKSICFQVPVLTKKGICIVVSPLIALMKDQVYNLRKRGIPAVAVFSGMTYKQIDTTLDNCIYGKTKFLYISPERLTTPLFIERIKKMNVSLLAVDEAHCVSQWGYDFRPPYLEIAAIREWLPKTPVLALTATATEDVVKDIQERLAFPKERVFQKSFARDNLAYVVLNEEGKINKLLDILRKVRGSGIVYVRNRRRTKDIAQFLQRRRISADFYHAGLNTEERSQKQDAWIKNETRIMVSTNAFGMGIDKPDVRVVVHMDMPDNLEAYFQEAGRGGRDGKKAFAILLYNDNDRKGLEKQFELSYPERSTIKRVYQALGSYYQLAVGSGEGESFDFEIVDFSKKYDIEIVKAFNALKILQREGLITLTESVFIPSSFQIIVEKEYLYDYLLKHKRAERLIKSILRNYQGAFNHYVGINEKRLASFLKIPQDYLNRLFVSLAKDNIIEYRPKKDRPQIVFSKGRIDQNNLILDKTLYDFLKNRHEYRMKTAIQYASAVVCRSQQLLRYFGEKDAPICGKCDVCLGRTKPQTVSNKDFKTYKREVEALLAKSALSLPDIMRHFEKQEEEKVLKTLSYLEDNDFIKQDKGMFFL